MKNRLLELKDTLVEFVDQDDHYALCLDMSDDDMLYVHKMLRAVDNEQVADVVLCFADPFDAAASWVDTLIRRLGEQIEGTNALIAADEQAEAPSLSPLPLDACDGHHPPAARLRAAMDHVAGLLPEGDHRIVWALLPVGIADPIGYRDLLRGILPIPDVQPWMHRHRVLLRDDRERPFMRAALATGAAGGPVPCVVNYALDMTAQAFSSDLAEQATDPTTPESERMQALLQLAGHDFAHGRPVEAVDKYGILYAYYEREQQPQMQALCLGGVAEVLLREGQVVEAKQKYQQGLALAVPAESLPVMLNLLLGAGACAMQLQQWDEGEGYYELANQVAGKAFNPYCKCDCLEQIGIARLALGRAREALESWNAAVGLGEQCQYYPRQRSVLERMAAVYRDADMTDEAESCAIKAEHCRRLEAAHAQPGGPA